MNYDSKFEQFYDNLVKSGNMPSQDVLDGVKKEKTKQSIAIILLIMYFAMILVLIVTGEEDIGRFVVVGLVIVAPIFIILVSSNKNTKEFSKQFKENVIKSVINNFGSFTYIPNGAISRVDYNEANFGNRYDIYNSEDLISGTINDNAKMRMAEIELIDEDTDDEGHTTYSIVFSGMYSIIDQNKNINAGVRILTSRWNIKNAKGYNIVSGDSEEFNKNFVVYSDNEIIAMQILTSDIMQKLVEFKRELNIKYEVIILNNKIYFRFRTGPMFEVVNYKEFYDKKTIYKYYRIFEFMISVSNNLIKIINETEI